MTFDVAAEIRELELTALKSARQFSFRRGSQKYYVTSRLKSPSSQTSPEFMHNIRPKTEN